jgi:hypothetical protein
VDVRSSLASGRKCEPSGLALDGMVRPEAACPLRNARAVEADVPLLVVVDSNRPFVVAMASLPMQWLAAKVPALITQGRSYRLIGRELGVSKNTVTEIVRRKRAPRPSPDRVGLPGPCRGVCQRAHPMAKPRGGTGRRPDRRHGDGLQRPAWDSSGPAELRQGMTAPSMLARGSERRSVRRLPGDPRRVSRARRASVAGLGPWTTAASPPGPGLAPLPRCGIPAPRSPRGRSAARRTPSRP